WIQTTATLGLLMSLLVILATRSYVGEKEFAEWGWRIPFLLSIVLLAMSAWLYVRPASWIRRSSLMMLLGTILFSGSLYAMAITGERALGVITPFGGVAWLIGWSFLILAAFRLPESECQSTTSPNSAEQ
ncbi:MAG: DUF423 domain-containing protein, partial [Thalassolituus sp.]